MKSNLFFTKSSLLSLISKITSSLPKISEMPQFLKNKFIHFKKEFISIKNKSRHLLETNIDLGLYHFYKGNISDAKTRFWLISIVKPHLPISYYNIGRCYFVLRNFDKAKKNLLKAIELDKNYDEAIYYLNKIKAPHKITYIPYIIIQQYFNYTSEYFVEHWVITKQYRAHEYVRSLIVNFFGPLSCNVKILDLGCGTGICGQFLKMKDIGNHITGIDISSHMINIARGCFVNGRQAYNELIHINMYDFLKNNNKNHLYDVIILTEVLHYTGDLSVIFKLVSTALNPQGIVIALVREVNEKDFSFVPEGDFFCHSLDYIKSIILKSNMQITYSSNCKIYGNQIDGLLFTASLTP
ncbi:methyltransferase domain-containing protein [Neoehrlichia mikurensis]|uniref:Methyltransferase domain-containing protein n=1 Tax=Neoehrlichia mikurensis TaxID=89586 RepID=A0A9Q9F5U7_9RICK|nr:methyltransferase [Neoehrlichia mikurensis]QXK92306.1 methyltransferase domain-containing protein [Neoehrlichia mikurensis]QXK92760.1 methyltransferase domain-containing protein [Neoehrlichia mikurensis]QXK94001.1 methyltransferase domain-containing protein [Neoehrlichia mikurensis]UTO55836.1 methyltransferase domain-containing protein [Neoehrlichia mikurensis]UTO56751.1 methyltransferase domain-containing protein [Neoehrlichia mikurensis]